MIRIHSHHLYLDLVSLLDTNSCFSDDLNNLFIEEGFPVLHGKHDMVMNLPCTMVSFSDSTFIIHPNSITKTRRPCSKLQGTFKLECHGCLCFVFLPYWQHTHGIDVASTVEPARRGTQGHHTVHFIFFQGLVPQLEPTTNPSFGGQELQPATLNCHLT
jgi:hypothetical protein